MLGTSIVFIAISQSTELDWNRVTTSEVESTHRN